MQGCNLAVIFEKLTLRNSYGIPYDKMSFECDIPQGGRDLKSPPKSHKYTVVTLVFLAFDFLTVVSMVC